MNKKSIKVSSLITHENVNHISVISINIEQNMVTSGSAVAMCRKKIRKNRLSPIWLSANLNQGHLNSKEMLKVYKRHKRHIERYKNVETFRALRPTKIIRDRRASLNTVCLNLHQKICIPTLVLKKLILNYRPYIDKLYQIYKRINDSISKKAYKYPQKTTFYQKTHKSLAKVKITQTVDQFKLFIDHDFGSSSQLLLSNYRTDIIKMFLKKYIIDKELFTSKFKTNWCHHIFVSSAHMYELISNEITPKRLHEYHFTLNNRQRGREAEEWVYKDYSNVKKKIAIRDCNLPFIIVSSDGFIGNITS
jgi:hypothetical protein